MRFYQQDRALPDQPRHGDQARDGREAPWAITNILKAFNQANEIANRERIEHAEYYFETGLLPPDGRKALRTPLITHGVVANRKVLETIAKYSLQQGLTAG